VKSDVPTLIFSGGIDPATPPRHGDRVAAFLPNAPCTLAAFLATTSLGAIWSCC